MEFTNYTYGSLEKAIVLRLDRNNKMSLKYTSLRKIKELLKVVVVQAGIPA
jgi:hypothetical protein